MSDDGPGISGTAARGVLSRPGDGYRDDGSRLRAPSRIGSRSGTDGRAAGREVDLRHDRVPLSIRSAREER
ncbi:hypothetical protein [Nocardia sp. BMG51109]|uniref:hypothetical protein n=1 Tax=Nocardia sp. BMG51109 TaxID=1056816 RepID=UPI000466651F|nr:hypothetical protein [Nocardia sp. BMG51109]